MAIAENISFDTTGFDLTEIINGVKIMSPSPYFSHQLIVKRLYDILNSFVSLKNSGVVLFSPLDVIFEEEQNRVQPDLIYIKKDNLGILKDWIRGVPNLVIEVVSKNSLKKDIIDKKEIYQKYGVPEYWIVFPEYQSIEIFCLETNQYKLFSYAEETGKIKSKIIENLEVEIKTIWE